MSGMYTQLMKYRLIIGAVVVLLIVGAGVYFFHGIPGVPKPVPDNATFSSGKFSFSYPRIYETREYATGVVSIGGSQPGGAFIPLIDVVQYKNDLQSATPASFDAFVTNQTHALCGSDASTETISCTNPVTKPYVTTAGLPGNQITMTLTRKNVKTGAVTTSSYGPIFVFNTTGAADPGTAVRYGAVLVYPTFSTFLLASSTGTLVEGIATTIVIK